MALDTNGEISNGDDKSLEGDGKQELRKELHLMDGIVLIVSTVIGTGVFATPGIILSDTGGDATLALFVWVLAAMLALFDCFIVAELGTLMPHAGGAYEWIRRVRAHESLDLGPLSVPLSLSPSRSFFVSLTPHIHARAFPSQPLYRL